MLSTGAMLIIGVIALKAFGGVQGITKMIGGIGDLLGTGGGAAGGFGGVGIISPGTVEQIDIISGMKLPEVALIAETQEVESTFDTLQNLSLIGGPLAYIAAPFLLDPIEKAYKADVLKTYIGRTSDLRSGAGGTVSGTWPTPDPIVDIPQPIAYPAAGKPWSKFLEDIQ